MKDLLDALLATLGGGIRANLPARIIFCGFIGAFLAYTLIVLFDLSTASRWPYTLGFLAGAFYGWRWYMDEPD